MGGGNFKIGGSGDSSINNDVNTDRPGFVERTKKFFGHNVSKGFKDSKKINQELINTKLNENNSIKNKYNLNDDLKSIKNKKNEIEKKILKNNKDINTLDFLLNNYKKVLLDEEPLNTFLEEVGNDEKIKFVNTYKGVYSLYNLSFSDSFKKVCYMMCFRAEGGEMKIDNKKIEIHENRKNELLKNNEALKVENENLNTFIENEEAIKELRTLITGKDSKFEK